MSEFTILSPAKVNLNLRVKGKRPDGLHSIESVVQPVGIFDEVSVRTLKSPGVAVHCGPECGPGEQNTAFVAANLFFLKSGAGGGAEIILKKSIPAGAGLGGASGNAAAVLSALNRAFGVFSDDELRFMGSEVGSDVPLFFGRGACRISDTGGTVETLGQFPPLHYVVCFPGFECSTAEVYGRWDETRPAPEAKAEMWDINFPLEAGNDLERAAVSLRSGLGEFRSLLEERGGARFRMTGSGSAFFSVFDTASAARAVYERVRGASRAGKFFLTASVEGLRGHAL